MVPLADQGRRTNNSYFFDLFADLTSVGGLASQGRRTIDASWAVLFAGQLPRAIAAGRADADEAKSRNRPRYTRGHAPAACAFRLYCPGVLPVRRVKQRMK